MGQTIFYELTRAWAYRRIAHPRMWVYTRALPAALLALTALFWVLVPEQPALIGATSVSASTLSLVATLPGFYFAGLAAVATFGGPSMDKIMPAPAPKLKTAVSRGFIDNELSNRQFLSYLFSYLVILSFSLCIMLLILVNFSESIGLAERFFENELPAGEILWACLSAVISLCITGLGASMLVSTLHAVFFLTEKIHQP
jgi:hypothetical protein